MLWSDAQRGFRDSKVEPRTSSTMISGETAGPDGNTVSGERNRPFGSESDRELMPGQQASSRESIVC